MSVDDHGLEVLKKSAEEIIFGDKAEYIIRFKPSFTNADITVFQHDFQLDVAVDKDTTVNHDFTISLGQVVELHQINLNATDVAEFEILIGDGAAAEVFTFIDLVDVATFTEVTYKKPIIRAGTTDGLTLRVAKTNLSNQAQDLVSKMILVVR